MNDHSRKIWKRLPLCHCLWKRVTSSLLFVLLFPLSPALAQAPCEVRWEGGALSVTAVQAPLSQVLREVAKRTDLEIHGLEALQDQVSVHFLNLPLRQALQELLANANYLFLERTAPQGSIQPALIFVFGKREVASPQRNMGEAEMFPERTKEREETEERLRMLQALALKGDEAGLRKFLTDPNPTIHAMALELFTELNGPKAIPLLVEATESKQAEVRFRALELLTNNSQADEQMVVSLLSEAVTGEDMAMKSYALRALANRGGPEATGYLSDALHDPDPSVRLMAIESIVRAVPPAQRLPLLQEAAQDQNEEVRLTASTWLEEGVPER